MVRFTMQASEPSGRLFRWWFAGCTPIGRTTYFTSIPRFMALDPSNSAPPGKAWGGVFDKATDRRVELFTESVSFDQRLYAHDIQGSLAHAQMLAKVGLITA